jgi:hypothetical protein
LPEPDEDDELPEFELDEELSLPPLSPLNPFLHKLERLIIKI